MTGRFGALSFELTYNGLTLTDGENFALTQITGWDDLPAIEDGSAPHVSADGSQTGWLRRTTRQISVEGDLAADPETVRATVRDARKALLNEASDKAISVNFGGDVEVVYGRVVFRVISGDTDHSLGWPHLTVQWTCNDPRRYAVAWQGGQTGLTQDSPPALWPWTWPVTWSGGAAVAGQFQAANSGTVDTPARLVFTGPLTTPSIVLGGKRLEFGLTLSASQALMVSAATGSARLVPSATVNDLWLQDVFPSTAGADRAPRLTPRSIPIQQLVVPAGSTVAAFGAASGSGLMKLGWRAASM